MGGETRTWSLETSDWKKEKRSELSSSSALCRCTPSLSLTIITALPKLSLLVGLRRSLHANA